MISLLLLSLLVALVGAGILFIGAAMISRAENTWKWTRWIWGTGGGLLVLTGVCTVCIGVIAVVGNCLKMAELLS